jgi:hypothetical protein
MKMDHTAYRPAARVMLATALILMVPALAMQFTDQVVWKAGDFVVAGALLAGTGFAYQLGARRAGNMAYRVAVGVALAAALLLVWVNLAVGIIGTEGNPANLMYVGVLAVGIVGVIAARARPERMARALFATALAQAVVAVIALVFTLDSPDDAPLKVLLVNGVFVALFVASALLFRHATRGTSPDQSQWK